MFQKLATAPDFWRRIAGVSKDQLRRQSRPSGMLGPPHGLVDISAPGPGGTAYAATSSASASNDRRTVAAAFWMFWQDAVIPAMASSPPPAQVVTYPKL